MYLTVFEEKNLVYLFTVKIISTFKPMYFSNFYKVKRHLMVFNICKLFTL